MDHSVLANTRSERVKAVRALHRRSARQRTGRLLAEGPQAVRELLEFAPETTLEVFVEQDSPRHDDLVEIARSHRLPVHVCTREVMAALCETVAPQGICAVCRPVDVPLGVALSSAPDGFVVVLTNVRDPGNAGTVIRGADAAGAAAVLVSDNSVDIYNPKVVRSTVGSLWHLPIAVGASIDTILAACRERGLVLLAADGVGEQLLPDTDLSRPHAWIMGNEAWGLEPEVREACDEVVRVPIYGHAESLNLAMAATVCVYASAAAQR